MSAVEAVSGIEAVSAVEAVSAIEALETPDDIEDADVPVAAGELVDAAKPRTPPNLDAGEAVDAA